MKWMTCMLLAALLAGCAEDDSTLLEPTEVKPTGDSTLAEGPSVASDETSQTSSPPSTVDQGPAPDGGPMQDEQPEPIDEPGPPEPDTAELPPATTKTQMSYIFIAHPDDEFESWSVIENSPANYAVFVLLTRGGHTGYCENPVDHPGLDQYPATPRDSEACKANRVTSFHRFLNRAAAVDAHLDRLEPAAPDVADVDAEVGRYEVWVGSKSARVIFDFPDGGLAPANLVAANELVRSLKGVVLPELPDYQALAGSFWNESYPDCVVYTHPDHRAVHVGVYRNDLDATVQRGRTCASDPDAVYFREITSATWRTFAGSPDYNNQGGEPGLFRLSYGWLNPGWTFSQDDTSFHSRSQSFWERRF